MKLEEMIEIMPNTDRVIVCVGKEEIFKGYVANAWNYIKDHRECRVISYGIYTEVYKREPGRERFNAVFYTNPELIGKIEEREGLTPELLEMDFTDLSFRIYTKIIIKK